MNKHGVLLNMMKDRILFMPGRCNHEGNQASLDSELVFVSAKPSPQPPPVILKRSKPPPPTVEDDLDTTSSDSDLSGSIRRRTPFLRDTKEQRLKDPEYLDICEISADAFFMNAKDGKNKLFSLTLNEVAPRTQRPPRTPRIARNGPCPCGSQSKYKKCCGSNSKDVEISETVGLNQDEIKQRLPSEYHDYLDVFDRSKADELPPHRPYDHRLEFMDGADTAKLPKTRIYPMSGHKLEQVKKYLDEHLRKGFITPSKAPFASPVLFAEKPNEGLRFCVDYRRLNEIIKRNRYSIPLIDEILTRVQGCKYLTRLDIIAAFNKLRMHSESEDYMIFVTSLGIYKYRVLPFGLTNGSATYQQYINDILFEYLNDFCQAYLDNILIHSKSKKEHVRHVRLIL